MNLPYLRLLAASLLLLPILPEAQAQWTRHRGDDGNATVAKADVPLTWSATENLLWSTDLPGPGSSSPILTGDFVFVTSFTGQGRKDLARQLHCLDRKTGAIRWTREVKGIAGEDPYSGFLTEHGYASNTPATDGERVFAFFGKSGVHAFDLEGEPLWNRAVGTESSRKAWGSASSPIVYGGIVFVVAADESQRILALDTKTGEAIWEEEAVLLEQYYGTPVIMTREGGREDLVLAANEEVWGLDPRSGKLRWFATHGLRGNISPSPVIVGETIVINGGYPRKGRVALRPALTGETPNDSLLWDESNASYVPTPVHHDGHLYWVDDQGFALCVELETGELIYKERVEQLKGAGGRNRPVYASPVLVGDRVYCVSRHAGTVVLAAKPKYEVLAHNVLEGDEGQFNGTPAIDGNRILLRSDSAIYCIGK